MKDARVLRIAAVAAILGATAHVAASVLEPDWLGEPQEAVRVVSESGFFIGGRLIDLIFVVLMVGALTVVGRTLANGPGGEWARLSQPVLVLMGALWAGAVLASAALKDVADAWAVATPEAQQSYLAAFDATVSVADALYFGAYAAHGVYLATIGASILIGGLYARWIGWAVVCSAALRLGGDMLVLVWDAAFLALLAGSLLFMTVLVALGVSLWQQSVLEARGRAPRRAAPVTRALEAEAP